MTRKREGNGQADMTDACRKTGKASIPCLLLLVASVVVVILHAIEFQLDHPPTPPLIYSHTCNVYPFSFPCPGNYFIHTQIRRDIDPPAAAWAVPKHACWKKFSYIAKEKAEDELLAAVLLSPAGRSHHFVYQYVARIYIYIYICFFFYLNFVILSG
jgi:hypothetical protein